MATHSYAYIPTGRKPFEYMLSEGWSDGYLSGVGMLWFQSTPHLDQAIEATRILGGSPCFVMPDGVYIVKEEGFYEDGVTDSLDPDDFDGYLHSEVGILSKVKNVFRHWFWWQA